MIFSPHCVFAVEVGKPPLQGGVQGHEAERDFEGCSSGAHRCGPHPHTGEESVWGDAPTAEEPLNHHAALHRSLQGQMTLKLSAFFFYYSAGIELFLF